MIRDKIGSGKGMPCFWAAMVTFSICLTTFSSVRSEIIPKSGFYDYDSKYTPGKTEYIVPARLPQEIAEKAQKLGVATYRALQCSGAVRVDFRLDRKGNLMILEVNTIPGLTETSLLPMAAAEAGIDFPTLAERMTLSARLNINAKIRNSKQ